MKNYFDETFFRLSTTGNFASIRIRIVKVNEPSVS